MRNKRVYELNSPGISLNIQKCLDIHWQTFLYNMSEHIFFTFVKTNHYVRRPDKKVRQPRFSIQKDCIRQILFHGFYEYLHPFRDGNGRLGRMFTNFILLKKDQPILIIPREKREEYISALRFIRKERTDEYLIDFFFNTAIEKCNLKLKKKTI